MSTPAHLYWGVFKNDLLVGFWPTEYAAQVIATAMGGEVRQITTPFR